MVKNNCGKMKRRIAFITLGCVIAAVNAIKAKTAEKKLEKEAE